MDIPPHAKRDADVAESAFGGERAVDPVKLAIRLRFLLTLVSLTVLQYGSVASSAQFITLNFFALSHASLNVSKPASEVLVPHCEATPSSEPCREAASDATFFTGSTSAISKSVAWFLALVLGGYSDSVGRRPIIKAKTVFSLLPTFALASHVFLGVSLWVYLVIGPVYEMFDINGVFLALLSDVVKSPGERGSAFSTFIAMVVAIAAFVIPTAAVLPMPIAVAVSLVAAMAKVTFVFVAFPETAPVGQKEDQQTGMFATAAAACTVLKRNSFISRMAVVLVVSGLAFAGFHTMNAAYFTAYIGMKRSESAALFVVCGLSLTVTFTCIAGPLSRRFGDVRTMQLSLAASIVSPLATVACAEKWQVFVLYLFIFGPVFLQIPTITAIKSNLVCDDEQGLVQGALAAVRVISIAVADAFFGWLYGWATDHGRSPSRTSALGPYLLVSFLGLCALGIACTLPPAMPKPEPLPASTPEAPLLADDRELPYSDASEVAGAAGVELASFPDSGAAGA